MERYFKRKLPPNFDENEDVSTSTQTDVNVQIDFSRALLPNFDENGVGTTQADLEIEFDLSDLSTDPGLRPPISNYHVAIRDRVRKTYLQRGPCQPRNHDFPFRKFGELQRRFVPAWFNEFPTWLEYSIAKDAVFCLCCYLFQPLNADQFVGKGFSSWKKKERFLKHVGGPNSPHNQAWSKCEELLKQNQHIQACFSKPMLNAAIDCVRFLLQQGLAFCEEDEFEDSNESGTFKEKFQGHFLGLLQFLSDHNQSIKALSLKNSSESHRFTSSEVQKDMVRAASIETINAILREMDDALFCILIDECRDISGEEQMLVIFRYVDKSGQVIERFVGLEHVTSIAAFSYKVELDILFSRLGFNMSRLRGQSYNGLSNTRDELNGLKTLILKESECAYYVHCFSQQLQLIVVALAKIHIDVNSLFCILAKLVNLVGTPCKHPDGLQEKQTLIFQALNGGKLSSGKVLSCKTTIKHSADSCWGSNYDSLVCITTMFSSIIDVLEYVADDGSTSMERAEANYLLNFMLTFNFAFSLHLMKDILAHTCELSQVLQRKDQDIVNAVKLVGLCKQRLQMMREGGWDSFLDEVSSFCAKHDIDVPNMDDMFPRRPRRRSQEEITNMNYYRVQFFNFVLEVQLQELNSRFNETNMELLLGLACLSPDDSFAAFDKKKLLRFAEFFPKEFSAMELMAVDSQLETYILDMRSSSEFSELKGISDLAKKLVETRKDKLYTLVYSLVTLALILPVAAATVQRAYSAMNFVKTQLKNEIGDQWIKDSLVVYIEQDVFRSIGNDAIVHRFQNMKKC